LVHERTLTYVGVSNDIDESGFMLIFHHHMPILGMTHHERNQHRRR
jgi:hypothetical protein